MRLATIGTEVLNKPFQLESRGFLDKIGDLFGKNLRPEDEHLDGSRHHGMVLLTIASSAAGNSRSMGSSVVAN